MLSWFKRYWAEVLSFGAVLFVYLLDLAPNRTWINTNSDGVHLTYAAQYLYPAHKGSAPLYLLLGHLFQYIPIGSNYWRMGLISVIGSFVSAILVYLCIKEHLKYKNNAKWFAIVGAIVFAGSALVISQTEIVKYYSLTTMFGLFSYYFLLKKHYSWSMAALGAGAAVHPIIVFFALPIILINKPMHQIKRLVLLVPFALFYLYVPLVSHFNPSPDMWNNTTVGRQIGDFLSTAGMLTGTLAIWDFPKRVIDTFGIIGLSLGLAIIPVGVYLVRNKHWLRNQLFWLFILPIGYFAIDLAPQTYVYMYPAVAFGAIIAAIALSKMRIQWLWAVGSVALVLLAYNVNYFDIGRTLDPKLNANVYYHELDAVPDGNILVAQQGWEWASIFVYNKDNGRNIIPVFAGSLIDSAYRTQLLNLYGIQVKPYENQSNQIIAQQEMTNSLIALNQNVWITQGTDIRNYGAEIVKASIIPVGAPMPVPTWHLKPNNPYDYITGAIEVSNWEPVLVSNYTCALFFLMGAAGYLLLKVLAKPFQKKKVKENVTSEV